MHGGGWWIAFSALLSGTYNVLIRDLGFDPEFALRVMAEEEVRVVMTIATPTPVDHRPPRGGRRRAHDLSKLLVYGSGGPSCHRP